MFLGVFIPDARLSRPRLVGADVHAWRFAEVAGGIAEAGRVAVFDSAGGEAVAFFSTAGSTGRDGDQLGAEGTPFGLWPSTRPATSSAGE